MSEAYRKQLESLTSLDALRSDPLSFMVGRMAKDVAGVNEIAGSMQRGHYGDAAKGYCFLLNESSESAEQNARRFADGCFYVLFGIDTGGNVSNFHSEASTYPYFYFDGARFDDGKLEGNDKWAPGYRMLWKK